MSKKTIALVILVAWLPFLMAAWDKDKPSSSTSLRDSNPEILANWSALETALEMVQIRLNLSWCASRWDLEPLRSPMTTRKPESRRLRAIARPCDP